MKKVLIIIVLLTAIAVFINKTPALKRFFVKDYKVVLCAGDSITADSYPQWLNLKFKEQGYNNIKVINMGKDGYTSGEYLNFMRLKTDWKRLFPDMVLLQLGTNDIRIDSDNTLTESFYQNMKTIIKLLRDEAKTHKSSIEIVLSTIPPVIECNTFDETSVERVSKEINPAIRALGIEMGLQVVDNHAFFVKHKELLPGIHPTQQGYRQLAKNWFKHISTRFRKK